MLQEQARRLGGTVLSWAAWRRRQISEHVCALAPFPHQAEDVKKRADYVAQLRRVGKVRAAASATACCCLLLFFIVVGACVPTPCVHPCSSTAAASSHDRCDLPGFRQSCHYAARALAFSSGTATSSRRETARLRRSCCCLAMTIQLYFHQHHLLRQSHEGVSRHAGAGGRGAARRRMCVCGAWWLGGAGQRARGAAAGRSSLHGAGDARCCC